MILSGTIHRDFVDGARALLDPIPERAGGAALAIVHRGETVIDVWGGTRDDEGSRWTRDTLALSLSTTKGVSSTVLHILARRRS